MKRPGVCATGCAPYPRWKTASASSPPPAADTDAVGFVRGAKSCFSVLHYTNGDLSGKDVSLIDDPTETDGEALSALLRQYYVNRSNWPKTILLPFEPEDKEDIERWLSDMAGRRVYLEVPQRGDRARFAEKAAVNAR